MIIIKSSDQKTQFNCISTAFFDEVLEEVRTRQISNNPKYKLEIWFQLIFGVSYLAHSIMWTCSKGVISVEYAESRFAVIRGNNPKFTLRIAEFVDPACFTKVVDSVCWIISRLEQRTCPLKNLDLWEVLMEFRDHYAKNQA